MDLDNLLCLLLSLLLGGIMLVFTWIKINYNITTNGTHLNHHIRSDLSLTDNDTYLDGIPECRPYRTIHVNNSVCTAINYKLISAQTANSNEACIVEEEFNKLDDGFNENAVEKNFSDFECVLCTVLKQRNSRNNSLWTNECAERLHALYMTYVAQKCVRHFSKENRFFEDGIINPCCLRLIRKKWIDPVQTPIFAQVASSLDMCDTESTI